MKYEWIDLPERKNCFTTRNAVLYDMDSDEIIQYYSANTKIVVVQGCTTDRGTFYRTESAVKANKNYAFEATALGLPTEIAPPSSHYKLQYTLSSALSPETEQSSKKQTAAAHTKSPSGGEATSKKATPKAKPVKVEKKAEKVEPVKPKKESFFKRLFRR